MLLISFIDSNILHALQTGIALQTKPFVIVLWFFYFGLVLIAERAVNLAFCIP